ncbi:Cytochrome_b5-like Heme/Steroid binding domain containing protein [Hexamita inflata]|uniref:Cytochrome b5-like Heme/Steroid binding domain containing protein n=1 Tax=Hexamita inflata TaxID=28002 RepID=A0AA86R9I7_9EUKA|nr:Cytochrome b5-like Heme/Steroid binding domain containing protein [Hexamita inflata]CAI9965299.1 Cytochrome b5-like Heme/Steroid binding domain containing protein [Hexamita inflata]CAI9968807.1 Cytochrome b5-like Heme/Steroid binding domain containing protein [Hexamita inflata]
MKVLPEMKRAELNKNGIKHIIIYNVVFDVTTYVTKHPGRQLILKAMTEDGLVCMIRRHGRNMDILRDRLSQLAVGKLPKAEQTDLTQVMQEYDQNKVLQLIIDLFGKQ